MFNLLKASLIDSSAIPKGQAADFFKGLEVTEKVFPLILIAAIVAIEIHRKLKKKSKYQ